jgi:hypothetical protein
MANQNGSSNGNGSAASGNKPEEIIVYHPIGDTGDFTEEPLKGGAEYSRRDETPPEIQDIFPEEDEVNPSSQN